ncbi:MAG: hypothetical protein LBR21_02600 [Propionibacteriaceae bacterium]|jgi:hypothetical protein|nr:hypothetical protein [Propionibacteriaceae bacterium]
MNENEIRALIALVIDAVEEVLHPKRGLVLFTGALLGFEDSLAALERLSGSMELEIVQTPSAKRVLDQAAIGRLGIPQAGEHLIANHDLLIIPTLTVNTVAKAAYAMADSLATNLISEFLMTGKRVVAASTAADPDSAEKRKWFPNMPAGQAAVLRENLARLGAMGVELCEAGELDAYLSVRRPAPLPSRHPARSEAKSQTAAGRSPRPGLEERSDESDLTRFGAPSQVRSCDFAQDDGVKRAQDDGVKRAQDVVPSHTAPTQKPILSAAQIQTLAPGSTLAVDKRTIVTHAAIDLATTKHIKIERR